MVLRLFHQPSHQYSIPIKTRSLSWLSFTFWCGHTNFKSCNYSSGLIFNEGWTIQDEQENSFSDFRVCGTLISVVWLLLWMRQTNGMLDTESEDQSEAGRDRAHWQPPRVTVSHSVNLRVLGPVSGTLRTRTDEAGIIVPVICQKVGDMYSWWFLIFIYLQKFFLETHIFVSISFQTRGFHLFYNIMRPGARRHSIAVGLSSSSGSGPGGW